VHRPLELLVTHRRFIRTTNLLERPFVEERRRLKIIPNGFGEEPVLKLMFAASCAPPTAGAACASPSSSRARPPPSERNSTRNMRLRSRRRQGHLSRAFPVNPRLDQIDPRQPRLSCVRSIPN
jgi:hypothetical protein